jgi:hypothetical protein
MSHKTKDRVKYARSTQLALRVLTLLGALGSLFCSIVIKGAAVTVIWIIRAGVSIVRPTQHFLTDLYCSP